MDIRAAVFDNLNSAVEGGHYEDLSEWSAEEITYELMAYAADLEDIDDHKVLLPYVEEWLALKNK
jgi:hypothetical protein